MGQRHQLFVIAKVNGRYRTLCAIHHQWLYGHTALKRCLDTLKIFSNSSTQMLVQQELTAAAKKRDEFWLDPDERIPFPFITTCLIIGASFGIDGDYHSVLIEPLNMAYDEGDNNDGRCTKSKTRLFWGPAIYVLPSQCKLL